MNAGPTRDPSPLFMVARCPEHGLHGERTDCYVCEGPVEQVPMLEVSYEDLGMLIEGVARFVQSPTSSARPLLHRLQDAYKALRPQGAS